MDGNKVKQVKIDTEAGEGILYLTECADVAEKLAEKGLPVLGILTGENREEPFSGVHYLAEEEALSDAGYLERVYRRLAGLPWQIAGTPRCIIRETTEADVDAFYEIYAHPSVTAYMEDLFPDREEELAYIAKYRRQIYEFYGFGIWTVTLRATGKVIGRAGLSMRPGFEEPELGFMIGAPWQRQGLAKEVCEAILRCGKEELGFQAVQAMARRENTASIALLRALGFAQESEWREDGTVYLRFLKNLSCKI